ncbi:MAG: hypothetical protein WB869_15690 [Candidatus Acidiferrales bacterium]
MAFPYSVTAPQALGVALKWGVVVVQKGSAAFGPAIGHQHSGELGGTLPVIL